MAASLTLELVFRGSDAQGGRLQFYDASQALVGFERVVSLTNHLLLNGEVITQSPSARGFEVFLLPPEEGSWKAVLAVVFGTALTVGVASKDSALGYLAVSALDYVIQESLGFEVDFDEMLGPQIERAFEQKAIPNKLSGDRFDSLIEKVEPGLRQCHRPIVFSESATNAQVNWNIGSSRGVMDGFLDENTYEYIARTVRSDDLQDFTGSVSSYNMNTFKGRIYIESLQRTVPFELAEAARSALAQSLIAGSLYENTVRSGVFKNLVVLRGFRNDSVNGRLKNIFVIEVNPKPNQKLLV